MVKCRIFQVLASFDCDIFTTYCALKTALCFYPAPASFWGANVMILKIFFAKKQQQMALLAQTTYS
jgi:hypothetical protein